MPESTPSPEVQALARVIRDRDAPGALESNLERFLEDAGLDATGARAMAQLGPSRLLAYRRLVHNGVRSVVTEWIPRSASRLGPDRLAIEVAEFLHERGGIASPFYRDIPRAFVDWAVPRWSDNDEVPAFLPDLARYERHYYDVRNDPAPDAAPTSEPIDIERPILVTPTARVERFQWSIHELPWEPEDRTLPERAPVTLAFWRRGDRTRQLPLSDREAVLLRRLIEGAPLREAIFAACAATGEAVDAETLGAVALWLKELSDRGVFFGAAPAG